MNATNHPHPLSPAEHAYADYELPVEGFKGTPEEIERQWYQQCYTGRGDSVLQLTWRAVLMGSLLGGVLSLTNIYIGLKSGWGFGVAITACILSYAIWTMFYRVGLARTPMTILENNCMQSTASSAGYSTGGTLVSAFSAYIMLNDQTLPVLTLMAWIFFLAVMGVTMAIPMKRQMINTEQLRFPSGIAAAETLKALHSTGGKGMRSAQALGWAAVLAAIHKFCDEGIPALIPKLSMLSPAHWLEKLSTAVVGAKLQTFTVSFLLDPLFLAAGIFTGLRVCISMLVAGTLCWAVFCPIMLDRGYIKLTVTEPLIQQPAGVDFFAAALPGASPRLALEPDQEIRFRPQAGVPSIEWKGVMSPAQRDVLMSLSEDPDYRLAIERIYIRSQFETAAPLPAWPSDLRLDEEHGALVSHDPRRGLVSEKLLSLAQVEKLKQMSASADFRAAVEAIAQRSLLPSATPLWASAPLPAKPKKLVPPQSLAQRLAFDEAQKVVLWRGEMSDGQRDELLKLSDDAAWRAAIGALFTASRERALPAPLPASLAGVVEYDAEAKVLRARGALSKEQEDALAAIQADPGAKHTYKVLTASAAAARSAPGFRDLVSLSLWPGTACMVTSGLLAFALQWRSALRAFGSLGAIFGGKRRRGDEIDAGIDRIETPMSWFIIGQLAGGAALCVLANQTFGIPYWETIIAVVLSFFLALIACRVTGETDTTPVGAMGKITQLVFGGISPAVGGTPAAFTHAMNTNLMAANVTASAAGCSADLLTDLKSGYLLGAHPRRQFIAQFAGIFMGTLVTATAFSALVPDSSMLGSDRFPAPAALTWSAVAQALSRGLGELSTVKIWCIAIGGAVGIVLPLLSVMLPKYAKVMPSAAGVGLAWTFHWHYSLSFFVGAVIGWIWKSNAPKNSEEFSFPVASGVIAGAALMGVALIIIENGPELVTRLFGL